MPILRNDVTFELNLSVRQSIRLSLDIEPYFMAGGAETRKHDPVTMVRPTSMLGQFRWFWRLLHPELTTDDLRAAEECVFGGASKPAPFALSVDVISDGQVVGSKPDTLPKGAREATNYLPEPGEPGGYLLFSARPTKRGALPAHVSKGVKVTVAITPPESPKVAGDLARALQLWSLLGGVGARTRRGVGAVQLIQGEAPASVAELKTRLEGLLSGVPAPPHRGRTIRKIWIGREFDNALKCFNELDTWYRNYRQDRSGQVGQGPGRGKSRWDEPDEIRRLTGRHKGTDAPKPPMGHHPQVWARGVLGLPIEFRFRDDDVDRGDPNVTTLRPEGAANADRMASPLLMRPLRLSSGKCVPVVTLLTGPYVRGAGFVLSGDTNFAVPVTTQIEQVFGDLLPGLTKAQPKNPLGLSIIYPHP